MKEKSLHYNMVPGLSHSFNCSSKHLKPTIFLMPLASPGPRFPTKLTEISTHTQCIRTWTSLLSFLASGDLSAGSF